MKRLLLPIAISAALLFATGTQAKTPTGATALCSDGSYSKAKSEQGACSSHGGVKDWYGPTQAAAPVPVAAPTPTAAPSVRTSLMKKPAPPVPAVTDSAVCKDGSTYSGTSHMGACSSHGGVATWSSNTVPMASAHAPAPMHAPAVAPAAPLPPPIYTPAGAAPTVARAPVAIPSQPAAGGGPGMVWVNTSSKVYHCSTDRWYGRTKRGEYLTEADAKAKGFRAEHGKTCM